MSYIHIHNIYIHKYINKSCFTGYQLIFLIMMHPSKHLKFIVEIHLEFSKLILFS